MSFQGLWRAVTSNALEKQQLSESCLGRIRVQPVEKSAWVGRTLFNVPVSTPCEVDQMEASGVSQRLTS